MTATNFILVDPAAGAAQNAVDSSLTEAGGSVLVNTNKVSIATATGNTAIAGTLGVTGNVAINTNKATIAATTGNTTIAGTCAIAGATTVASLACTGALAVNTNKFTVASATGNTAVAGTLGVVGATTVASLACTGALAVNTNKFTVAAATGNTLVAGTLAVTGALTASGSVTVGAGFFTPVTTVNAATYNVLTTDRILHVTYTATGACAIDLKTAQLVNGRRLIIKDAGGATEVNSITITTEGAETIDGAASKVINAAYGVVELYSNGTHWYVV